jgi:TP901 family phage tail tape measure protein
MKAEKEVKIKISGDEKGFNQSLTRMENKVNNFGKKAASTVSKTFGGLGKGVLALGGGLGIGAIAAQQARRFISVRERYIDAAVAGGLDSAGMIKLQQDVDESSRKTGKGPGEFLDAIDQILEVTGNIKIATDNLETMGRVSVASGAEMADVGRIVANVGDQFDGSSGAVLKFCDILYAQGKAGAFTTKNMAQYGARIASAGATMGVKNAEQFRPFGAVMQMGIKSAGTSDRSMSAIEAAVNEIIGKRKEIYKYSKFDILDPKTKTLKSFEDIFKGIIRGTKGSEEKLGRIFGGSAILAFRTPARLFREGGGFKEFDRLKSMGGSGETIAADFNKRKALSTVMKTKDLALEGERMSDRVLEPAVEKIGQLLGDLNSFIDIGPLDTIRNAQRGREQFWSDFVNKNITNNNVIHIKINGDRVTTSTDKLNVKNSVVLKKKGEIVPSVY